MARNIKVSRVSNVCSNIAWPLCVVSSGKQVDTLPHQRAWAIETAKEKGWDLQRIGDFEDDSSGKKGPRKLVRKLVAAIEATPPPERPQWVLMIRLDRVGRGSIVASQMVLQELKDMGVRVWTRDGGEEKTDSAMQQLITAAKLAVGEHENEIRTEKAIATHARKKRAGEHTGGIPYGMVVIDRHLRPFEPQATFVRDIFEKRLHGWGLMRLSKYARAHAPPKLRSDGSVRHLQWTESTVARLLENPRYRGAVVTHDLFDEARGLSAADTGHFFHGGRDSRHKFPLRGSIRCTCGSMLTTTVAGDHKFKVRYYVCRNSSHADGVPYHNADHLEQHFAQRLRELSADEEILRADVCDATPLLRSRDDLRERLSDIRARERRAWELGEDCDIDRAQLRDRLADLRKQREQIEAVLKGTENEIVAVTSARRARNEIISIISAIADHWESNCDVEMKREAALAAAALAHGMHVAPAGRGGARKGVIQFGGLAEESLVQALAGIRLSENWMALRA